MSHGAGLVRTTCSSGSAFGPRAGAGQRGTSTSEGMLDPVYPRTHGALLKVAQMVREAGPQGHTEWPRKEGIREGTRLAAGAGRNPPEHRAAGGRVGDGGAKVRLEEGVLPESWLCSPRPGTQDHPRSLLP